MAVEKMNPPRKTIDVSLNIEDATLLAVEMLKRGSRKTGKKAVMTMGIGSRIHHSAVMIVTPSAGEALGLLSSRVTRSNKKGIAITIGTKN